MRARNMGRVVVGLLLAVTAGRRSEGQGTDTGAPSAGVPTPQQLFDRHNAAIGGRAAMAAYTSIHMTATVQITGFNGGTLKRDLYRMKPNRFLERTTGKWDWRTGVDGRYAWTTQDNPNGVLLTGKSAARLRERADFFSMFFALSQFKTVDRVQSVTLDTETVYQVRVVRKDDTVDTLYFDSMRGYLVAETAQGFFEGGTGIKKQGDATERYTPQRYLVAYIDYQPYGRLLLPRIMEERINPGHFETTTILRVEFNTVDAAMFFMPPDLEMRLPR